MDCKEHCELWDQLFKFSRQLMAVSQELTHQKTLLGIEGSWGDDLEPEVLSRALERLLHWYRFKLDETMKERLIAVLRGAPRSLPEIP